MFIVLITYKKPLEVIDQLLAAHRSYLDSGYQRNYLIASGPTNPRTGGVLLSQLTDRSQLEAFLKKDPFLIHGAVDYKIIEFLPVKYHKDFEKLIENKMEK